jgi:uncharacterized protein (DUF305 family)
VDRLVIALVIAISVTACRSAGAGPQAQGATGITPAEQARSELEHPRYTAAGVQFASGMIGHHAQAIVMAGWAPTHDASPAVRDLCMRIAVSQADEIKFMQDWLRVRHLPVPEADTTARMSGMSGMSGTAHAALMPGMLTPAQMTELDQSRGPVFDKLFLTDMIMHHRGALRMVQDLDASAQGEDEALMTYATNVAADQSAEIGRMQRMLNSLP